MASTRAPKKEKHPKPDGDTDFVSLQPPAWNDSGKGIICKDGAGGGAEKTTKPKSKKKSKKKKASTKGNGPKASQNNRAAAEADFKPDSRPTESSSERGGAVDLPAPAPGTMASANDAQPTVFVDDESAVGATIGSVNEQGGSAKIVLDASGVRASQSESSAGRLKCSSTSKNDEGSSGISGACGLSVPFAEAELVATDTRNKETIRQMHERKTRLAADPRCPLLGRKQMIVFAFVCLLIIIIIIIIRIIAPWNRPVSTLAPTTSPTGTLVEQRRDYLLEEIGPLVLPADAIEAGQEPADFFAVYGTSQYAALEWMAALDLELDVIATPSHLLVERYAVVVLYYATSGPTAWNQSLNFVSPGLPLCDWNNGAAGDSLAGVSCNNTGTRVTDIAISNNGLEGPIPWELSLLEFLIDLHLNDNALAGTIPIELISLTNLETLTFENNSLTGPLITEMSTMTRLLSLDLSGNRLTGNLPPSWGESLTDVVWLALDENQIDGTLPSEWGALTNLLELRLSGNDLHGSIPTEFGRLTKLTTLDLGANVNLGYTDSPFVRAYYLPTELGNLSNLTDFYIQDTRFCGTMPSEYAKLTCLNTFWFYNTNLEGSVDDILCSSWGGATNTGLHGDCAGSDPEITCICCMCCGEPTSIGCTMGQIS